MDSSLPRFTNRLSLETSPYLLQHAHNPVDWHAWGPEAFALARGQDKPIFLSVGYSTCYWCHVMERQSFENEAIAQVMNRLFINIKVDREERPDVDQLYMNAVQVLTRQGGWPMSVFLTPELRPFYGGTYFPPVDGHGRPGFPRLLEGIADAWKNRREQVNQSASQLVKILNDMGEPARADTAFEIDTRLIETIITQSTADFDAADGGFGGAPKFPRETLLRLILTANRISPDKKRMDELLHTLDAMANGGIRDHLGGAFHRYSTDAQWLVPHFEIMLYDNGMLAWIYAEAFAQTAIQRYADVARGIVDFILSDLTSPQGAFYTALDAEVDAQEGLSYLWTMDETNQLLGKDAALFNRVYGLDQGPNFGDPHHGDGTPDKNVLFLPMPMTERARQEGLSEGELEAKLEPLRQRLLAARKLRKQPRLDEKVLTSWNALAIEGLAHAGKVLNEPRYIAAASTAANYLLAAHRTTDGGLYRGSRDGKVKHEGFLDDYAFLCQALLTLAKVTGSPERRGQAQQIYSAMKDRFHDETSGGFFFSKSGAHDLIVRQKIGSDSPLPSGNAIAGAVALALGDRQVCEATLGVFAGQMREWGPGSSAMVETALLAVHNGEAIQVDPAGASVMPEKPKVVTMTAAWASPGRLVVTVAIAPGRHISSNQNTPGLLQTRLTVSGDLARSVRQVIYPAPVRRQFPFADELLDVYEGQIRLEVQREPLSERRPGVLTLNFQACSDTSCLAPDVVQLNIE